MMFICGKYQLDLTNPCVMGVVNVTPDSFSDGGQYASTNKAVEHALQLVEEGASILDIGGESTRPGATPVGLDEELARVILVIEKLAKIVNIPLSIDTYKPKVMQAAIDAGISIVNDINALQAPGALEVVANSDVGVCLMHMQGSPQTMQIDPQYDDVVAEVSAFLTARFNIVMQAGISSSRILLDPGFGFGKRTMHNIALLKQLAQLRQIGQPLLVGLSRKSVLGQVLGDNKTDRVAASIAASVVAAINGANILRVHDVRATVDALKVIAALRG
ncbi:MAG: dihydropteroate synthase [Methylophilaceae bacterium]|nr:dihydropteroate synthase [Methylophilaceae bacterium]